MEGRPREEPGERARVMTWRWTVEPSPPLHGGSEPPEVRVSNGVRRRCAGGATAERTLPNRAVTGEHLSEQLGDP